MSYRAQVCAGFLAFIFCMGCSSTRTHSAAQAVAEPFTPVVEQSKHIVQSSDSYFGTTSASR
jgi:hypothetical protein